MGRIIVIGMGSRDFSQINDRAKEYLQSDIKKFSRTERHEVIKILGQDKEITYFDDIYENSNDLIDVDSQIVEVLIKESKEEDIIYLVPGSPFVLEKSIDMLIEMKLPLEVINNESFVELVFSRILHVTEGYKVISGRDYKNSKVDFSLDLIISEIDNEYLLDEIILELSEIYPIDTKFSIVKDGGLPTEEIYTSNLGNYERKIIPNHQTTLVIHKPTEEVYDFSDLVETSDILRGPNGCPWDIEQTHESMRQGLLEEAYEVVDAINKDNPEDIKEELGDLLFQVVMHSQIASENGDFNIIDVINVVNKKLILRHPHVFGELFLDKSQKVLQNWDSIKYSQRNMEKFWERLNDSRGLPSTIRAYKIIDKVTRIGFDWDEVNQVLDKVKEEYYEVVESLRDPQSLEEELGDLLFTVCNLSHYLGYEPEILLSRTCDKFVDRFKIMEEIATSEDKDIKSLAKEELEKFWQISKSL